MVYFWLVVAIILALIVGGFVVAAYVNRADADDRTFSIVGAGVTFAILVAFTLAMSVTTVSPRAVAVQTSFGRYVNTLDSGFHWIAPWSQTEEFTRILQPAHFAGKNGSIPINLVGGGRGSTDLVVQWQISESKDGAKELWMQYKEFDSVRDNLVDNQARNVAREVLGSYEPVQAIAGDNLPKINDKIKAVLQERVQDYGVIIRSVSVTNVALDQRTQESLNKIVEANANITRAKAEQERAQIDANTVEIRDKQGALSPEANQRYCLDVVNAWDASKGGPLPAGFTCNVGAPFVVTK